MDKSKGTAGAAVPVRNLGIGERWASIIGGSLLLGYGFRRRTLPGAAAAALGSNLLYSGCTGFSCILQGLGIHRTGEGRGPSTSVPYELGVRVDKSVTINKPRAEVYAFWRNFENLPKFMRHVHSVSRLDGNRSHWIAQSLGGRTVEWDAEMNNEVENQLIGWRTLPGSDVDSAGSVRFHTAPGGRGTEIHLSLQYNPPGGELGAAVLKLIGSDPARQIQEDLRRLKQLLETGEIATTQGQPHGRDGVCVQSRPRVRRARPQRTESEGVEQASEQSFPASDAPAWNMPVEQAIG